MSDEFEGFESANTTPVPDVLFDVLLAKLSGTELKVLLYIIRRTRGFKKDTDAISLSQFTDGIKTKEGKQLDKGCGIKNRTAVSHALAKLEEMKCIKSTKGKDPLGDAAVSLYSIHFAQGVVQKAYHRSAKGVPPVVQETYHRGNQNALPVVQKAYPQETVLQLDSEQQTEIQERALLSSPNEDARVFSETENDSYRHDHTRKEDDWNCRNWRGAHGGLEVASCEEYQAWIDSGGRDVPTDKFPAIASTSGEAASPPVALTRQSHTSSSLSVDGAVKSGGKVTRPRASDEQPIPEHAASATSPPAAQMAAGVVTWESILNDWDAVQGRPQSRTDRMRKAAREGVVANPTREELKGCRDWLPTTDNPNKPYYRKKGVGLWDVIDRMDEYRSYLALSIEPAPLADMPKPKPMDIYTANSMDKEKMKRRADEMIANAAKKGLHLHGSQ